MPSRDDQPATRDAIAALALPEAAAALLQDIARVVSRRGAKGPARRGARILVTGGTACERACVAEAVAGSLVRPLVVMVAGASVSNYIDETSPPLSTVLASADGADAVLLFDEADALMGRAGTAITPRRSAALLRYVESYGGVAIVGVAMRRSLDPAFVRRIEFVAEFPLPDVAEREAPWHGAFPRCRARG